MKLDELIDRATCSGRHSEGKAPARRIPQAVTIKASNLNFFSSHFILSLLFLALIILFASLEFDSIRLSSIVASNTGCLSCVRFYFFVLGLAWPGARASVCANSAPRRPPASESSPPAPGNICRASNR